MIEQVTNTMNPQAKPGHDLARLRETAGQIVGNAFYGTMLKMMRENPFKGEYGHGGRGEEVFSAQLHQRYAEMMGAGGDNALTDVIFKAYARQQELISGRSANGEAQDLKETAA